MAELPDWLSPAVMIGVLLVAALIANQVTLWILRSVIRRIASRTRATWDDRLMDRKVFARLSLTVPAAIVYYGIGPVLGLSPLEIQQPADQLGVLALIISRVALAFIVVSATMTFSALLEVVNDVYNESYAEAKSRPIKGYLQVVNIVGYVAAAVVVVSVLADRSPLVFLSGLGALTAVVMLVFRDTILSLVASVQIMSNDMIRIGDWIEMPQANADGDVIDIALHTVKIQNWDKTISTVPTHKFISESFKNWRGMKEAGGRRIKRPLNLDVSTIRFMEEGEIERWSRHELLRDYMAEKRGELQRWKESRTWDEDVIPEVRRLTNVGTFRAYVDAYLRAHPRIHDQMTLLVRQLAPTPQGLPIELYCFTNDTVWANYERIQSDIFDHLIAILPEFGLRAFQEPAGSDFASIARG